MVDIFKASITTRGQTSQRMRSASFIISLNWVENPGNAERTWSEVKTEVIRMLQRRELEH
jgi:hypothetical protein